MQETCAGDGAPDPRFERRAVHDPLCAGPSDAGKRSKAWAIEYADLGEMLTRYAPAAMKEGWNTMPDGEEVFYITTPSAGLWATKAKLNDPARRETGRSGGCARGARCWVLSLRSLTLSLWRSERR